MAGTRDLPVGFVALALSIAAAAGQAQAQVAVGGARFEDLGATSPTNPVRRVDFGAPRGSIGVIDFDNDGYYDVFCNDNGGLAKRLYRNVASPAVPGGRGFVDVSQTAGISGDADATARSFGTVVVFDYNNDGFDDIYTGGNGPGGAGLLLRNNGDGTFTNVTVAARVRSPVNVFPESASAVDFNHDGFLDLFVDNIGSPGQTFTLFLNNGDGTFTNRADLVPQPGYSGNIYASAFTDIDHDGWADHVALLNNRVGLVLRNVANPAGGRMFVALTAAQSGMSFLGPAPMGIAVGDYDGDGWLDLAITDASTGTYYRNNNGVLARITPFGTFFGWGTTWLDTTNKGRLDNYQAGSFGSANIDHLRLNNGDGSWTDARAALNTPALASQHCARVDFDNDGLEDIITNNPTRFVSVYRNSAVSPGSGPANHWFKIKLHGDAVAGPPSGVSRPVNRGAIGAVVRVTAGGVTQTREILAGSSYGATEDPRAHFGLGSAATVDRIEIIWPRAGNLEERTQSLMGPFGADRIVSIAPVACPPDLAGPVLVVRQPQPTAACPGGSAAFTVGVSGIGAFTYQWRRDGVAIDSAVNPSAVTATLLISRATLGDRGAYDCVVSDPCGGALSSAGELRVCPADFNCDGVVDPDDLSDFITCAFAADGCASPDLSGGGNITTDDLRDFIVAYFEGGCG